jgi:hypothetical protein
VGGAGVLVFQQVVMIARPSFLDYIRGGCEVAFTVSDLVSICFGSKGDNQLCVTMRQVAVDFTASNGDPRDTRSLHFVDPYNPHTDNNAYIQAMTSVGQVLECYDTDKQFPVYGFGGRVGPTVSHCFALNGRDEAPEVVGLEGILGVYKHAIRQVTLAGPTYFSEVIQRVAVDATHCTPTQQKYHVLLIITGKHRDDDDDHGCDDVKNLMRMLRMMMIFHHGHHQHQHKYQRSIDITDDDLCALFLRWHH